MKPRIKAALVVFPIILALAALAWTFTIPASLNEGGPFTSPMNKPDSVLGNWILLNFIIGVMVLFIGGAVIFGLGCAVYFPYMWAVKRFEQGQPEPIRDPYVGLSRKKLRTRLRIVAHERDDAREDYRGARNERNEARNQATRYQARYYAMVEERNRTARALEAAHERLDAAGLGD